MCRYSPFTERMDVTGQVEYEQVQIVDIDNGARLTTYVIDGDNRIVDTGCDPAAPVPGASRPAAATSVPEPVPQGS